MSRLASWTAILVGGAVLIGWMFDISRLKSWLPHFTMKANTALNLVLAGLSLWLLQAGAPEGSRRGWKEQAARACAGIVVLVGLLTATEYLSGWDLGIDQLLAREEAGAIETSHPGRMGLNTAVNFVLLGLALLFVDVETRRGRRPAQGLALGAVGVSMVSLAGHIYGVPPLYSIASYTHMALHTTVVFLLLSAGILCARPEAGLMATFASDTTGGLLARRLLPAAVLIPLGIGWLRVLGQQMGLYGTEFGAALFAVFTMMALAVVVFWNARLVHRADEERRRAEKALRDSQERYRVQFESNPHPSWVYDLETLAILDVNPAALRHYGYSREEFLSMTIKDIRPAEDVPALLASVAKAAADVEMTGTWKHRKKDGTIIAAEITSHRLRYEKRDARLVVATDITERLRVETALHDSEERFRSVVETATDAVVSASRAGDIIYFNRAAERMFGYSSEEALGQPLTLLMPERFHEAHRAGLRRFLSTGEARVIGRTVELAGRRKDGTEFPLQLSLASWRLREEVFFTGILSDITERKRSETEIREINMELEASNRELEAFCYSVSHDLRAPLRGIDGFSQALLEDYGHKVDARGQDYVRRVRTATQRMGMLIDDLLNLSRVTRVEMHREEVDLGTLAEPIAAELQKCEPNRQVEFIVAPALRAQGDLRLLRQVLENLLSNAWKFTSKHERARIEFGRSELDGKVAYFVRDDGAGFDPAYADRLFGPFQRLHSASEFPGTGVGLATVQRIVHRHGGEVWAEGAVGKGATFYFTLG